MRVLHVITGLGLGGAETSLVKLVAATPEIEHRIVSLLPDGPLAATARAAGATVQSIDVSPSPVALLRVGRLIRIMREFAPDVVQTWLYHADFMGFLAARLARRPGRTVPVAWNIRCADMDLSHYRLATRFTVRLLALLSRLPQAIVTNSRAAVEHHRKLGYAGDFTVIPNGFDTARFAPDAAARARLRAEWGMTVDQPLIGFVGRLDAMKDLPLLCRALSLAAVRQEDVRAVFCGQWLGPNDGAAQRLLRRHGLEGRVRLLGPRDDVPAVLSALDCLVLSSRSEGFPNVLGEAMACGVPCATTDAGDAALIVGGEGRVVPRGDADALSRAILDILTLSPDEKAALGRRARERIEREFSIAAMAGRYRDLWASLAAKAAPSS